jgi:hypothetical protein
MAIFDLQHAFAAVEFACGPQQDRDLLGAVQVHRPRL